MKLFEYGELGLEFTLQRNIHRDFNNIMFHGIGRYKTKVLFISGGSTRFITSIILFPVSPVRFRPTHISSSQFDFKKGSSRFTL